MSKRNNRRTAIGILAAANKDLKWRHDRLSTELGLANAENERIRRFRVDDRDDFLHLNMAIHKSDILMAHDCDCAISDVFDNMKAKFMQAVREELANDLEAHMKIERDLEKNPISEQLVLEYQYEPVKPKPEGL